MDYTSNEISPAQVKMDVGLTREISLARPDITDLERRYVMEVLASPYLSIGPRLEAFEKRLAAYTGVAHAVAVNSGTSALHLVVRALGIGEGDEVITTPFSFVASSNCILFERARPVFVDIEPVAMNIDPGLVEKAITPRTKAILAVDLFGHPAQWNRLTALAETHHLNLIEDAADALGSEYHGRRCGSFGDAAIFGFYHSKQITTGEGGAVLTDNSAIADLCRSLRSHGRSSSDGWLRYDMLGYNYRLSEINCALGQAQLERIEEILRMRARVAGYYNERLEDLEQVRIPCVASGIKMSYFVYVIRLADEYPPEYRNRVLQELQKRGIGCGDYFVPIHLQPFCQELGYREGDFPVAEAAGARTIALPFHNNLSEQDVDYVVKSLKELL